MKLTIIRGIPGSGKSTMAKALGCFHVEADMFHVRDGTYDWSPENVKKAHSWCAGMVEQALNAGMDVVVSNTFVKKWELEPYVQMGLAHGAIIEKVTAKGNFKDLHNVPSEVVERMRREFEE